MNIQDLQATKTEIEQARERTVAEYLRLQESLHRLDGSLITITALIEREEKQTEGAENVKHESDE